MNATVINREVKKDGGFMAQENTNIKPPKNPMADELTEVSLANAGNALAMIRDMELERLNGVEYSDKAMYARLNLLESVIETVEYEYQKSLGSVGE